MWQTIAVIAVPLVSVLIGLFRGGGDTRLSRRVKHHAEILKVLDGFTKASDAMEGLLVEEIGVLKDRELARSRRRVNGGNLAVAVILAVVTAGATFWLTTFASEHGRDPWAWIGVTLLSLLAVTLVIFTVAGFSTIYNPPSNKKP
ncbi:hypothetical protein [Curtobacterium sp. KBS0715]|uniref:hypothetical protein n=1 Tax=Curtobacterium sp. KBS0715 TaxID=1179671 RepID=UPI00117F5B0A|nr:hypothetical protein [Curtobacterium sp. KBS0715]